MKPKTDNYGNPTCPVCGNWPMQITDDGCEPRQWTGCCPSVVACLHCGMEFTAQYHISLKAKRINKKKIKENVDYGYATRAVDNIWGDVSMFSEHYYTIRSSLESLQAEAKKSRKPSLLIYQSIRAQDGERPFLVLVALPDGRAKVWMKIVPASYSPAKSLHAMFAEIPVASGATSTNKKIKKAAYDAIIRATLESLEK